jgi:6-phosphogluconolactonase/glucosamine-6-phosphate isomerase/deaminase
MKMLNIMGVSIIEIKAFSDYSKMCKTIAMEIANTVKINPQALICLAAGHTSLGVFHEMIAMAKEGSISFDKCTFVGLDEWAGKGNDDDGSCIGFMKINLFDKLGIQDERIIFYDGKGDLSAECARVDNYLKLNGHIDYMLLGMGMNGHLGLNEPGTPFNRYSHKYFKKDTELAGGITMGMLHFKEAKRVVLMINGAKKAAVVDKLINSEPNETLPASFIKSLESASLYLDNELVLALNKK